MRKKKENWLKIHILADRFRQGSQIGLNRVKWERKYCQAKTGQQQGYASILQAREPRQEPGRPGTDPHVEVVTCWDYSIVIDRHISTPFSIEVRDKRFAALIS